MNYRKNNQNEKPTAPPPPPPVAHEPDNDYARGKQDGRLEAFREVWDLLVNAEDESGHILLELNRVCNGVRAFIIKADPKLSEEAER